MRAHPAAKACAAVLFAAGCARAQSGPAAPPAALSAADQQSVHRELDGKCKAVRPGDVVHFTLRIEGVQEARAVSANLQMRLGRVYVKDSGLPPPDFRSLGGGGAATRDASQGNVYHFMFTVPHDVFTGVYHGAGVFVTAAGSDDVVGYGGARSVDVTNHTMKEIRNYCLIVVGPYGGAGRPLVTDFKGGPIDRNAASNTQGPSSSRIFLPTQ